MEQAKQILQTTFGFSEFRGNQAAIIAALQNNEDAMVLMPTGGGKSLCYQIPALLKPGLTVVVSPLIALMHDQVNALLQLGVKAAYLNSSLSLNEARDIYRRLMNQDIKLLYVAPERLLTDNFLNILEDLEVSLFAIDEAHCVSQWGHDFRPEYIQLNILHERFPDVPRIALTATADEPTRNEIIDKLGLHSARQFISSFDRPNISYRIIPKNHVRDQLQHFISAFHAEDSGIVYCLSRKRVEDIAEYLTNKGYKALPYHAGLDNKTRLANQNRFLQEENIIIVATVAFGMGIDKSNVRFVIHLDVPKSLEAYYQETGRAGRDGLAANAVLFYGLSDVVLLRQMLDKSEATEQHKRLERRKLDALLGFCETALCRRHVLLNYFGEQYPQTCQNCDNCLEPVMTQDGKIPAQKALSCVIRTGQRFGVKHLTDILLGKTTPQIDKFSHHELSTFGIGQEFSANQWQSIFRQLVAANLLYVDMEGYGSLKLTLKSKAALKGEEPISLRIEPDKKERVSKRKSKKETVLAPEDKFWLTLKSKRLALAKEQGVAPYIIFHDTTLHEIHEKRPKTLSDFALITGVGKEKLKRYGHIFIELVENEST